MQPLFIPQKLKDVFARAQQEVDTLVIQNYAFAREAKNPRGNLDTHEIQQIIASLKDNIYESEIQVRGQQSILFFNSRIRSCSVYIRWYLGVADVYPLKEKREEVTGYCLAVAAYALGMSINFGWSGPIVGRKVVVWEAKSYLPYWFDTVFFAPFSWRIDNKIVIFELNAATDFGILAGHATLLFKFIKYQQLKGINLRCDSKVDAGYLKIKFSNTYEEVVRQKTRWLSNSPGPAPLIPKILLPPSIQRWFGKIQKAGAPNNQLLSQIPSQPIQQQQNIDNDNNIVRGGGGDNSSMNVEFDSVNNNNGDGDEAKDVGGDGVGDNGDDDDADSIIFCELKAKCFALESLMSYVLINNGMDVNFYDIFANKPEWNVLPQFRDIILERNNYGNVAPSRIRYGKSLVKIEEYMNKHPDKLWYDEYISREIININDNQSEEKDVQLQTATDDIPYINLMDSHSSDDNIVNMNINSMQQQHQISVWDRVLFNDFLKVNNNNNQSVFVDDTQTFANYPTIGNKSNIDYIPSSLPLQQQQLAQTQFTPEPVLEEQKRPSSIPLQQQQLAQVQLTPLPAFEEQKRPSPDSIPPSNRSSQEIARNTQYDILDNDLQLTTIHDDIDQFNQAMEEDDNDDELDPDYMWKINGLDDFFQ
eukprot:191459_1